MIAAVEQPSATPLIPYAIRPYDPDSEKNFVAATWSRSFMSTHWAKGLPQEDYFHGQSAVINAALQRGHALVAQHSEHGVLLGHVVCERRFDTPIIHWVHVKREYWGHGIARALLAEALRRVHREGDKRVYYTHQKMPESNLGRKRGWVFNPYLAHMRDRDG